MSTNKSRLDRTAMAAAVAKFYAGVRISRELRGRWKQIRIRIRKRMRMRSKRRWL